MKTTSLHKLIVLGAVLVAAAPAFAKSKAVTVAILDAGGRETDKVSVNVPDDGTLAVGRQGEEIDKPLMPPPPGAPGIVPPGAKLPKVFVGVTVEARSKGEALEVNVIERRLYQALNAGVPPANGGSKVELKVAPDRADPKGDKPTYKHIGESRLKTTFIGTSNEIEVNNRKFVVTVK